MQDKTYGILKNRYRGKRWLHITLTEHCHV